MQLASTAAHFRLRQFLSLTKPRVVSLIVFCAVIGMFLAVPGMVPPKLLLAATIGIWLVAGAAAAVNCLVEQRIDAVMTRTRARPLPRGELTSLQTLTFAGAVGGTGLWMLYALVNPLTMWLTFGTFIGYAVVYTVLLKPMTPQNIVIGGASGAMPPVLGWAPDAAGNARAPLHSAVRAALHADSVRLGPAPFRPRDERLDLSRRRSRLERNIPGLRSASLP